MTEKANKTNRRTLIILILAFLLPVLVPWALLKWYPDLFRGMKTTNYGEFIKTRHKLDYKAYRIYKTGKDFSVATFKRNWLYVYVAGSSCDEVCQFNLDTQRRVELAIGRNSARLQRVLVVTGTPDKAGIEELQKKFPNLAVLDAKGKPASDIAKQFSVDKNSDVTANRYIYLVDPLGRLRMYYKTHMPTDKKKNLLLLKGMEKDLKKWLYR